MHSGRCWQPKSSGWNVVADTPSHMKSIWSRDYRPLSEPFKSTHDLQPIERPSTKGREMVVKLSGLKLTGVKRPRTGVCFSAVIRLWKCNLAVLICQVCYRATACNAMHGIAVAILSVCVSVWQIHVLWQNEIIVCQYLNTIRNRNISSPLVFPLQWGLLGIVPFNPKYSPKVTHPLQKTPTSTDFCL